MTAPINKKFKVRQYLFDHDAVAAECYVTRDLISRFPGLGEGLVFEWLPNDQQALILDALSSRMRSMLLSRDVRTSHEKSVLVPYPTALNYFKCWLDKIGFLKLLPVWARLRLTPHFSCQFMAHITRHICPHLVGNDKLHLGFLCPDEPVFKEDGNK